MQTGEYEGLISPDAYEYLDNTPQEDFLHDELLQEQEEMEDYSFFDDEDEDYSADSEEDIPWDGQEDDSHLYAYSSLFDEIDNEEDNSGFVQPEESQESSYPELYDEDEEEEEQEPQQLQEPSVFNRIVSLIPQSSRCAAYLLACNEEQREKISEAVKNAVAAWSSDRRDKMFTIPGGSMTIAVVSPSADPMTDSQRMQSIAAVMQANGKANWTGLFLFTDADGNLESAEARDIVPSMFPVWQWRTILLLAERLSKKRT